MKVGMMGEIYSFFKGTQVDLLWFQIKERVFII